MTTMYRAIVGRLRYLGQDRAEFQFVVEQRGRHMSTLCQASWAWIKRVVRYLKGSSRAVLRFDYHVKPKSIASWADGDFAGCVQTRKSTSAGVVASGNHMWRSWSKNHAVIAFSSGNAEYQALVTAGSASLRVQALMRELAIHIHGSIDLSSNASAAIGISNRVAVVAAG